jgi:hypothetical protein
MQIMDAAILTPELLSGVIMPFISARTELQHILDQMRGESVQPVRIRQISQSSEIKVDVGLGEIVKALMELRPGDAKSGVETSEKAIRLKNWKTRRPSCATKTSTRPRP